MLWSSSRNNLQYLCTEHLSCKTSAILTWSVFSWAFAQALRIIFTFFSGRSGPTLDWPARLRIALGSAKGLAYLHEDCELKPIPTCYPFSFLFNRKLCCCLSHDFTFFYFTGHPKIIHRDIKASNILLDYRFEAKVLYTFFFVPFLCKIPSLFPPVPTKYSLWSKKSVASCTYDVVFSQHFKWIGGSSWLWSVPWMPN